MRVTTTLKGYKKLDKKLEKLASKDRKKAMRKGARASAKIVQKKAKQLAPKASGELRKSIKVRSLKRSRRWVGARVVSDLQHTWPQESGTEHFKGQKYMERAQEITRDKATETYKETVLEEINKIWEG